MTREHHASVWLDEFYEKIKLNDSDDSDVDPNFVPDIVHDLRNYIILEMKMIMILTTPIIISALFLNMSFN